VVRLDDKKKTGRPLKLTEARFRRMIVLIREGNTNSAACRIEGRELPIRSGEITFSGSQPGGASWPKQRGFAMRFGVITRSRWSKARCRKTGLRRFLSQGFQSKLSRVSVIYGPGAQPRVVLMGRLAVFGAGATRLHGGGLWISAIMPLRGLRHIAAKGGDSKERSCPLRSPS
jgi:hypothetical protein